MSDSRPSAAPGADPAPVSGAPYARVKRHLKQGLAQGRWVPGSLMPSEAELVSQFGVSRMTAGRALRELQAEGLVTRVQGVGTFAAHLHHVASTLTIQDLHDEIRERGHRHQLEQLLLVREKMPPDIAVALGLRSGSLAFHSVVVHLEDGVPLQLEDRWVNPKAAPGYLDVDFTQTTPTHYLLAVAPLWEASYRIQACAASAPEARLLRIASGDACLVVTRRTAHRRTPITLVRLVHPGSRYQLAGSFRP